MILGLSTSLNMDSPQGWAKAHVAAGCKAVVFPLNCNDDKDMIAAYAKAAEDNGLVIAEVGVWKNTLAADEAEKEKAIQYAIGQLKMADEIGAKCCVNIIGTPHGPIWDGAYAKNFSKETWDDAIKMVQRIIDEAKPKRTKYSIETMPWMYPSSPDEYVRMIDGVNREAFGVHLDFINMINSADRYFFSDDFMDDCFAKLGDKIISCHLKDVMLRPEYTFQLKECACGEGSINLKKYAELASNVNVNMPMIIEHLASDEAYLESMKYTSELLKEYLA